jgi:hypothetical protein
MMRAIFIQDVDPTTRMMTNILGEKIDAAAR